MTLYLLIINAAALLLMFTDKTLARKNMRRIPERTLLLSAILGGCPGAILGMRLFRHKTRHNKFRLGLPAILLVQIALVILLKKING